MIYQASNKDLITYDLISYEVSPVPTSIFKPDGTMRSTPKSELKNALKVELSSRNIKKIIHAQFIDGCALLWVVQWADNVPSFLKAFRKDIYDRFREL